jgi:hypothetical protein
MFPVEQSERGNIKDARKQKITFLYLVAKDFRKFTVVDEKLGTRILDKHKDPLTV